MATTRRRARGARPTKAPDGANGHLEAIRDQEAAVDELGASFDRLRLAGREALGVTGTAGVSSLRETFSTAGVGIYPALALGLLVMVDQLQTSALTIMGPEISGVLGIPRPSYALVLVLKTLVVTVAALPFAALVQRRARRAAVCITTAFGWAALTAMTGFTISIWGLLLVVAAAGAATASVRSVHQPLLLDSYPPPSRVRVMSFYRGFDNVGDIVGPMVIGLSVVIVGVTWRGVFVALGLIALAAAVAASGLRDPGFGKWDTDKVRDVARTDAGAAGELDESEVSLGFFEIARRLMLIPTVARILVSFAVLGMLLAPFLTYLAFFLQERWGLDPAGRSAFSAVMPVFGIVGLRLFGRWGEDLFRQDPARLVRLAGLLLSIGITCIALALFMPVFVVMALMFGVGMGMITIISPAMSLPMYSIVPAHMRPHLGALQGIFLAGVGGTAGLLLLGGVDRRFGTTGAILSLAVPGIIGGLLMRSAGRTVNADLDRMISGIIEEEEVRGMTARGVRLPMLSCRHVDFSYGELQVLFDVNFTVDEGEMVALLGTNGAGKSTLLKVVSGLGLPNHGTVRFFGGEITYLDAERRTRLGISQIPGGRAVFGPLSVVENLRLFSYSLGRDKRAVDRGMEATFEAFPALDGKRNQQASTLSGGEQQMLALGKALLLQPRLLLIDELSLGLAPVIVAQLLEMVRRINQEGTSIVLVEQSVNLALSLVQHVYFMEKGEIRFDGRAQDLLERRDLLRSVFLEGAAQGLEATSGPAGRARRPVDRLE